MYRAVNMFISSLKLNILTQGQGMISFWSQPQAAIQRTAVIGTSKVGSRSWTQISLVISEEKGAKLFICTVRTFWGCWEAVLRLNPTLTVSSSGHLEKEEFGDCTEGIVQSMPTMTYQIGLSHLNFNLIRASDSPTAAVGAIITLTCVCVYVWSCCLSNVLQTFPAIVWKFV